MKQIINLLLLPFHLLFYIIHHLLKKCFRWLFKQDFESLNATIQNQRDSIDKKVMKIQDLEKILHKNELVVELLKKEIFFQLYYRYKRRRTFNNFNKFEYR